MIVGDFNSVAVNWDRTNMKTTGEATCLKYNQEKLNQLRWHRLAADDELQHLLRAKALGHIGARITPQSDSTNHEKPKGDQE